MLRNRTSRNTILTMIVIMIVGFLMNINVLFPIKGERFIQRGWVKGITIYEGPMPRHLSLIQQSEMLRLLNDSICLQEGNAGLLMEEKVDWGFDRIVIHRFSKGDMVLVPSGISDGKIVFIASARDLQQTCLLQTSCTQLQTILQNLTMQ